MKNNNPLNRQMISSKELARRVGYTNDYISRLCRYGKVGGKKIGNTWYVDELSLKKFIDEQEDQNKNWNGELAKKRKIEYQGDQSGQSEDVRSPYFTFSRIAIILSGIILVVSVSTAFGRVNSAALPLLIPAQVLVSTSAQSAASILSDASNLFTDASVSAVDGVKTAFASLVRTLSSLGNTTNSSPAPVGTDSKSITVKSTTNAALPFVNKINAPQSAPSPALLGINTSATINGALRVSGSSALGGNVSIGGSATINGALRVSGSSVLSGRLQALGGIDTNGADINAGSVTVNDALRVSGSSVLSGRLQALGGIDTNNADINAGSGRVFATNIINAITAGENVTVTGTPQNPIISSLAASSVVNNITEVTEIREIRIGGGSRVTSIGMSVPSFLSVSGSPVTSSGTLDVTYSGSALPIANGGTGLSSIADAAILATNADNVLTAVTAGASQSIRRNAGNTAWEAFTPGSGGSGTVGSGTIGQFPYYAAAGTTVTATSSIFLATSGNIGIGTTTPGSLLSLGNTGANAINISATATSTFGSGINVLTGCFAVNSTCLPTSGGTVTSLTATYPFLTSGSTGAITISTAFGTTTANTFSALNIFNANASTTQLTTTGSAYLATTGGSVGIGTTTPGTLLSLGNTGNDTVNISATATSTFGSGLSIRTGCFAVNGTCLSAAGLGGLTNVTGTWPIISSGGSTPNITFGGLSTSSPLAAGAALLYATGVNTVASAATSTLAVGTGLTSSGTLGYQVGGTNSSISFAAIAANSLWANATGGSAVPTAIATSSLGINFANLVGTASVAQGGTGQTSFAQGWLHSNGTTLTSSTSPTVNYITATSTTATSTFAGGVRVSGGGVTINTLDCSGYLNSGKLTVGANGSVTCSDDNGGAGGGISTYLGLTDTPSSYTANAIQYANAGATALTQSSSLTFDGTKLITNFASTTALTVSGQGYFGAASTTNLIISSVPSSLVLTSSTGLAGAYGGASCPGALIQTINADGTVTCANSGAGTGGGSVTSVAQTVPAFLSISGSPITTTGTLAITLSGTALPVSSGGTGQTTFTSGQLLYGNGTTAFSSVATSSLSVGTGISVTSGTLGSQIGGTNVTLGIADNALTLAQLSQISAGFILGNNTGTTANVTSFATSSLFGTGSGGQVLAWNNGVPQWVATSSINNGISSLSATYPLLTTGSTGAVTISTAFGTTTANTFSALNIFNANASTTQLTTTGSAYLATAGGNVGIGMTTPTQKLDVTGNINTSAGSAYMYNGSNVITASTTLGNYFFGGAGNLTMTSTYNTALGLNALISDTSGYSNTAVGSYALILNTTGTWNTSVGKDSLFSNTTGSGNTAIGLQSLYDLNITADNGSGKNTAIGFNTGRGIVTGVNNTILGANITGLAAALSNNIIIADGAGNQRINVGSTGNVGIGTTSPYSLFSLSNSATTAVNTPLFTIASTTGGTSTSTLMTILANGNVGIGTSDPSKKMEIAGVAGTNALLVTGGSIKVTGQDANGYEMSLGSGGAGTILLGGINSGGQLTMTTAGVNMTGGNVGIASSSPWGLLSVNPNALGSDVPSFVIGSSTATNFIVTNGGNVGVGMTTPTQKLDVTGNINTSAGSAYMYNGSNVITASTTLANYFFGGAGNLTMTGVNNTALGLQALYSNTSGYSNTATGKQALYSNLDGTWNTANGVSALFANTSGSGNSAFGEYALNANTTGSNNSALGEQALLSNTTGSGNTAAGVDALNELNITANNGTGNNTAIGYNTGRGIVTGVNNTILGANITGLAAALSNNIIIADGAGNRRINVGSTGNVGIGTTTPYSLLSLSNSATTAVDTPLFTIASTTGGTSTSTLMTVLANGNVGIGTAAPGYPLDVRGSNFPLNVVSGAYGLLRLESTDGGSEGQLSVVLANTAAPFRIITSNSSPITLDPGGNERVRVTSDGNFGIGTTTPWGLLSVNPNGITGPSFVIGSSTATNFIVTNGGNVGIGTTSPSSLLSVQGNSYVSGAAFFGGAITATSTLTLSALGTPAGSLLAVNASGQLIATSTIGVANLALAKGNFLVGNDAGVAQATSSIFISSTGSVGIGTTSPSYKLDINGIVRNHGLITHNIALSGSYGSIITAAVGSSTGYTNFSGGIGTGGADSVGGPFNNALRLTHTGNLVNIGSIQGGETLLTNSGTFATKVDYTTGANPDGSVFGDVNGDGKVDLIVANFGAATVSVLMNNGNGTFATKVDYITGSAPYAVSIGDLNGDGKGDLATANKNDATVSVLMNNGNGTFATKVDYTAGTGPNSVSIGDVNGDGKADLVVANTTGTTVSILMNNGTGTFAAKVDYTTGTSPKSVSIGDVNGDGKADLAVANFGATSVSVLMNNGNGTFATKVDYTTGTAPNSVSIGDVNGDGKADLAVANSTATSVSVLMNNGNGTFATKVDYTTGAVPYTVSIGDLNGDGKGDLAVANDTGGTVSVLMNNGNGTFATKVDYTAGTGPNSASIGDVNGDGKADLAVVNYTSSNVSVFLNQSKTLFYAQASTGNTGIGTSTPYSKLTIWGAGTGTGQTFSVINNASTTLMQILDNGNVGIASSSPWGLLSVNPNALGSGVPSFVIGSSTATNFIVTNGGNVGIGTASPTNKFHVVGSGTGQLNAMLENDGNQAILNYNAWGSQAWHSGSFAASRGRGTKASPDYPSDGDNLFSMNMGGWQGTEMATDNGIRIAFQADGTWTSASTPGKVTFSVNDGTTAWNGGAQSMVFRSTGYLGIGEAAPGSRLSVSGGATIGASYSTTAAPTNGLLVQGSVGIGTTTPWGLLSINPNGITGPSFVIGSSTATNFIVTNGGNVGIGTTSPATLLEIGGSTANVTLGGYKSCTGFTSNANGLVACTASDQRLKQDVVSLDDSSGLSAINALNPVSFYWKPETERSTQQQYGLIAQQVQSVFPSLVVTSSPTVLTPDGTLSVNYEGLISPMIRAIQELDQRTNWMQNAATSTVLTVDVAGNVGIGTATPSHTLTVSGDVSATGFINTSTREAKTDIAYATASSTEDMLNQLVNLKVATYRYKIEDQNDPLRLGFIAEDAQIVAPEILSSDGAGVDLYKLATFTLSGVQALAAKQAILTTRVDSLESRMAKLEDGSISTASDSPIPFSTTSLASALDSFGVLIQKGIAQFNTLVFRQLVAGKDADGTSSAGSVSVLKGNTVALVNNSLVSPSTKVFVTFNAQLTGSWWVSDKATGSFRVVLSEPQTNDVSFDYFLVQTEGQIVTSTSATTISESDVTPPAITLLGDNPLRISVGGVFTDPGVTVIDAVDGPTPYTTFINGIQEEVSAATIDTASQTSYIITYSANDRAGNSSTAMRSVIVGNLDEAVSTSGTMTASSTPSSIDTTDTTPPAVTLTGAAALQINVGDVFTDPGATASDVVDGDLTSKIVTKGSIDVLKSGLYTLTYSATDAAGNAGSVSRVVTVIVSTSSTATSTASGPLTQEQASN